MFPLTDQHRHHRQLDLQALYKMVTGKLRSGTLNYAMPRGIGASQLLFAQRAAL